MAGDVVMTGTANPTARRGTAPGTSPGATPPGTPGVDRGAAFAAGVPKMPRRVIYLALAVILAIGLGGTLLSRFLASTTSASKTTAKSTAAFTTTVPAAGTPAVGSSGPAIHSAAPPAAKALSAPMPAFLGLDKLKPRPAPAVTLTDARSGQPLSLADLRGHVVVLTFANAACNDLCPVLASELHQADAALGTPAVPVTFVTVNTDPLDLATSHAAVLSQPTLGSMSNWRFLTGTVGRLDPVWKRYHISITTDRTTHVASHNDFLYVIGPNGKLAWRATPFANESKKGTFSLPAQEVARYARGIARVASYVAAGK